MRNFAREVEVAVRHVFLQSKSTFGHRFRPVGRRKGDFDMYFHSRIERSTSTRNSACELEVAVRYVFSQSKSTSMSRFRPGEGEKVDFDMYFASENARPLRCVISHANSRWPFDTYFCSRSAFFTPPAGPQGPLGPANHDRKWQADFDP